jgi:hypothetical protein
LIAATVSAVGRNPEQPAQLAVLVLEQAHHLVVGVPPVGQTGCGRVRLVAVLVEPGTRLLVEPLAGDVPPAVHLDAEVVDVVELERRGLPEHLVAGGVVAGDRDELEVAVGAQRLDGDHLVMGPLRDVLGDGVQHRALGLVAPRPSPRAYPQPVVVHHRSRHRPEPDARDVTPDRAHPDPLPQDGRGLVTRG